MITLKSILNEAYLNLIREELSFDMARKYTSIDRNPMMQGALEDIFRKLKRKSNNKLNMYDRIYFKFSTDTVSKSKIEPEVQSTIEKANYKIKDYKKGIAQDKYGREIKLGKVLNKLKAKDLLNKYNTDPIRSGKNVNSPYIVFSMDAEDIASMSTDRRWTSCMDLYDGSNSHYVQYDIEEGTFIVYVIRDGDWNIDDPIGRVLIKPFVNTRNSFDVLYVPEETVYGENIGNFREKVVEVLEKIQGEKIGNFKLKGQLYCDSKYEVTKHPKVIQDMLDGKVKPKTKEEVALILDTFTDSFDVDEYQISDDLTVDVEGSIVLSEKNLKAIPIQFVKVTGRFDCSNNNLKTLEGAPKEVGGNFICSDNDVEFTKEDVRAVTDVKGRIIV